LRSELALYYFPIYWSINIPHSIEVELIPSLLSLAQRIRSIVNEEKSGVSRERERFHPAKEINACLLKLEQKGF